MANLLYQQIEMLSREKHIEPEIVVSAIEDAMVVAARKFYKTEEDLRAKFNQETGQVDVYSVHIVVEEVTDPKKEISLAEAKKKNPSAEVGTEITATKPTDVLGRIAAQTAKQVILQKVREAERDTIYNEYHNRVGELVTVIVKRAEGPDLIVDMGRTEARLPKREQSKLETYNIGERLRVVIKMVDRAAKGPQVVVSRADASLVQRLFEMEVPEIYDGTVQIRFAAREAGERTKVAVASRDKDVDPVGACVGMKGMRVQSIIRELRGEKIDIIPDNEEQMTALTAPTTPLTSLAGVGAKTIEKIEAAGINSVEKLAGMTPEQLMEIPGIGEKMVDKIYQAVNRFYEGGAEASAEEGGAARAEETEATETAETATAETTESNEAPAETAEAAEAETAEAAEGGTTEGAEISEAAEKTATTEESAAETAPAESEDKAGQEEAKS